METSMFIARIFGLSYLILGVGFVLNRQAFKGVMDDFCKNKALLFYGGVFALVIGIVMILTHNVWIANWTVIITIIGWISFIKGIWITVFPGTVSKFIQCYQNNERLLTGQAIGTLIFGAVLTYFGFFAG